MGWEVSKGEVYSQAELLVGPREGELQKQRCLHKLLDQAHEDEEGREPEEEKTLTGDEPES